MNLRQRGQFWALLLGLALAAPGFTPAQDKPSSDVPVQVLPHSSILPRRTGQPNASRDHSM